MRNLTPVLFLMVVSLVLAELLSGNTSITLLLNPLYLCALLFVGYGLPVLFIREVSVRWHAGLLSLFLMGIAFGILNEGFLAKTLIRNTGVPVSFYDGYAGFLGINYAWSVMILSWHAIFAVTTPILLSHIFFREKARQRWLSNTMLAVIGLIVAGIALVQFLFGTVAGIVGTIPMAALFAAIMALCFACAYVVRNTCALVDGVRQLALYPLMVGVLFLFCLLMVPAVLAGAHASMLALVLSVPVVLLVLYGIVRTYSWITIPHIAMIGLGGYIFQGVLTIMLVGSKPFMTPTILLIEALVVFFVIKMVRMYTTPISTSL